MLFGFLSILPSLSAQPALTLPPSGDNNVSEVTQYIGSIVSVTIRYSSPDVAGPDGASRRGKIWGGLVPYGLTDQGFGTSKAAPWRAGANKNTTVHFSHDVLVEGKPIPAGTYGFFVIAMESGPWTLIFSKNSTSWGSFFYDEKEDALRVQVTPETIAFRNWLTFDFIDRGQDKATVALQWEEKSLPFTISVPNASSLYLDKIREELRTSPGFSWQNWVSAVQFCLQRNTNLEEALEWADAAISRPWVGEANYQTLSTKAAVLIALGRKEEAKAEMNRAIAHPSATANNIHLYGRQLLQEGAKKEALNIFLMNAKRFNNAWPTNVGLARGYSAMGDFKNALKYAKLAAAEAPDAINRKSMEDAVAKLEKKEDIN